MTAVSAPRAMATKSRMARRPLDILAKVSRSISTLKWPLLATMAPSFIFSKCGCARTSQLPVTVQKKSPILAASSDGITR